MYVCKMLAQCDIYMLKSHVATRENINLWAAQLCAPSAMLT
jgi:hypothetical protein